MTPQYEILLIFDPATSSDECKALLTELFDNRLVKFTVLPNNTAAYKVKNVTAVAYAVAHVEKASPTEIQEFRRRVKLLRNVLRHLIVNLHTEKGLGKKPRRVKVLPPSRFTNIRGHRAITTTRKNGFERKNVSLPVKQTHPTTHSFSSVKKPLVKPHDNTVPLANPLVKLAEKTVSVKTTESVAKSLKDKQNEIANEMSPKPKQDKEKS